MIVQQKGLSKQDLYILRRAFMGQTTEGIAPQNAVVAGLLKLDWKNPQTLGIAQQVLIDHIPAIFAIDPNAPPPVESAAAETYIPPLPAEAQLSDAALEAASKVGGWYQDAVKWATERSPMTPPHFLEAAILWLIGLAVNRRVCIEFHERIYPMLYLLVVAETSKYAKSTGMNAIRALLLGSMPHMVIPGSTTTEGMMELLSGEPPANLEKLSRRDKEMIEAGRKFAGQRGVILDEYSSLLASMKKDYMAGFIELLMRMYDNQDFEQHHTKSGGMLIVKYPGISIFGATTPAAMARTTSYEMWENGAMARYLIMFRDHPMPYNPNYISFVPPAHLLAGLSRLHKSLPGIPGNDIASELVSDVQEWHPVKATISPEAHAQYQRYMKAVYYDMLTEDLDERLHGNYRRLHMQTVKMALSLACSDWAQGEMKDPPRIELGHFALAQTISEKARASLHRLMPVLSQTSDTRTRRTILSTLANYPAGLTITELGDKVGRNNTDVRSSLEALMEAGQVEMIEHKPHTGRPTCLYRLVSS